MSEGNAQNLENEIRAIVARITEIEPEKITLEANFVENLGMDSMMALEILASIEKRYKLKIPEENLMKITNLKQTIELVNSFLNK
ncbi:MAG: acyl carrier protein [Candidatus Omnitrophota bacterium]|nr:MAG: acyl carrier protein [Candidatus Omnitrophota bacterium]